MYICIYMYMCTCTHSLYSDSPLYIYMYVGITTNGEFNSLRWKGNTRPLTVLQLKREARAKYQNKGLKSLLDMITPIGMCISITRHIHLFQHS